MAGVRTNEHGERVVGGTRRADGSIRPERKVRDGYVPPDEQQKYMSRGKKVRRPRPQSLRLARPTSRSLQRNR